jgi:hypothetical protein
MLQIVDAPVINLCENVRYVYCSLSYRRNTPNDPKEAKGLRCRTTHYLLQGGVLYKMSFVHPILWSVSAAVADYILREIHEDVYGNHSGGWSLARKALHVGY